MLVKRVITRLQKLTQLAFGQNSDYADYDYLANAVAVVNDDIEAELDSLDLHFDTEVVVLTGVPANTKDLRNYQGTGGPLECMLFPNSTDGSSPVEWRPTGQSDLDWMPVAQVGKVVDTNTATWNTGLTTSDSAAVVSWEWRGGIIYISPCSIVVDLRVRGEFEPTFADNDAQPFVKGLTNVLAYKAGSLIASLGANNPGAAAFFEKGHLNAKFVFETRLSKSKHGQVIRLGSRRTQFSGAAGQFTPPIVG